MTSPEGRESTDALSQATAAGFLVDGCKGPVRPQHEMPWRHGPRVCVLRLFGVPALAGGLAFDAIPLVSAAA